MSFFWGKGGWQGARLHWIRKQTGVRPEPLFDLILFLIKYQTLYK